jgi:hypothetical protein
MVNGTAGAMRRFRGARTTLQGKFPASSTPTPETNRAEDDRHEGDKSAAGWTAALNYGVGENSMQTLNESLLRMVLALLIAALLVVTFVSVHFMEYQTVAH